MHRQPKKKIAIDLCNTVCDVNGMIEKMLGLNRQKNSYPINGLDSSIFEKYPDIFLLPDAFFNAAKCLSFLAEEYEIIYLTKRPAAAHDVTVVYLREHNFPQGSIIFSKDKGMDAQNLGIYFAIDDAPEEIRNYAAHGVPCFVKKQGYNIDMGIEIEWSKLYYSLQRGFQLNNLIADGIKKAGPVTNTQLF